MNDSALVLLSGGQDSATCLAWAARHFSHVETIGFDYGQPHAIELAVRDRLRAGIKALGGCTIGSDVVVTLPRLEWAAPRSDDLPNTFVPGRNLLFFLHAAIVAERRGLKHLVGGMCETDYSGYPDCRDDTLKALQATLNLGMSTRFVIDTPLMWRDKAATWAMAAEIGGEKLVELILEESHSCYAGDREHRHPWGYGCNACAACELRARGWSRFCRDLAS